MACPFFVPRELLSSVQWRNPSRLPLGGGWRGDCCAGGSDVEPDDAAIRDFCNLGYATDCPRLPAARDWDAVRFSVAGASAEQIALWYVCERDHGPIEHGKLTFDLLRRSWHDPHPDPRVQRLAACYLETWQARQIPNGDHP